MAKHERRTEVDPCAAGRSALREGHWEAARTAFEGALAAGESAEAYEGLSWAAWWLDDADAVFAARERAYLLYRRSGDATSAARLATWLAADELDFRGGDAVARGWLRRAHRLLDPLEPGSDHGWLAFQDGYVAHAGGDTGRARERARYAADLGRRLGIADLEMLGLALARRSSHADASKRGCVAWTRRPRLHSRVRPRSRSRPRGRAASS